MASSARAKRDRARNTLGADFSGLLQGHVPAQPGDFLLVDVLADLFADLGNRPNS
jgi:hypothetical protein